MVGWTRRNRQREADWNRHWKSYEKRRASMTPAQRLEEDVSEFERDMVSEKAWTEFTIVTFPALILCISAAFLAMSYSP